ncbi:ribonuclease HII [Aestuariivivens sediminis]|uniref:ribonuclease HII n=1 Tax=Aestuariivivens sediminis TaxID=2913557 RepID=UPI001F5622DF|nr:ribonuclease HII [Aestuariivivens sediminis]
MRFFCFVILATTLLGCTNSKTNPSKLLHYLPENVSVIIETPSLETLRSNLKNNDLVNQFSKNGIYNVISSKLDFCELLNPNGKMLIGLGLNTQDTLEFSIVTKYHKDLFLRDSLEHYAEEQQEYHGKSVIKSTFKNQIVYSTVIDSVFLASTSINSLDDAYQNTAPENELEKIYHTTNADKTLSMTLKPGHPFMKSLFLNDSLSYNRLTDYTALDMDVNQNKLVFHGITNAADSSKKLINVFKYTVPQQNQMQHITPSNSDGYMSFTFGDYYVFKDNLIRYNGNDSIANTTNLFENIIEVGVIYEGQNQAVVLNAMDVIATNDALLAEQTKIDQYRQVDIFSFSQPHLFADTFTPFVTQNGFITYCVLDSFFVFAQTIDMLQNIIVNYQNNTTLSNYGPFIDTRDQLSSASSLMLVCNGTALKKIISSSFSEALNLELDDYKTSALQFVYDSNFAHVNGMIGKSKAKAVEQSVNEEFSITLDSELLNAPQFVTNHRTGQKEIVVQDVRNYLYLISNEGKILWKKQLHGPVLGRIEQIDIYKNGRLQLVFVTPHRLYVMDRNGKDVAPFPGRFNDDITQPLSVFDYDKNKNYRLLVTQGENVLMYNTQAKMVSGFTFKKANDVIIHQPQHFRMGNKDYLTIKTRNKLHILNRTGKDRVVPKTNNTYSEEAIYLYKNKFTTTSDDGKLITIDVRGNTAIQDLKLSERHHIYTSSKTLVTQNDNELSIRGTTRALDYGNYSPPKLFYIYDKIYVTLTDFQSQKVYLFDSQNEPIPNFPVYGNSLIDLDDIDRDRKLEFVTQGDNNTIILYQIN